MHVVWQLTDVCRILAILDKEFWSEFPHGKQLASPIYLKCGFLKKSFIMNAPLVSCPFPVIRFGWVCCCTHPKRMTGNGQLTRCAFRINDLLRNPHFCTKNFNIHRLTKLRNWAKYVIKSNRYIGTYLDLFSYM